MPRLGSDPLTLSCLWCPSCWWLVILGGWLLTTSPPLVSFSMWPSLYDQLWKICSAGLQVIFRKSCSTSSCCLSVWVEQKELSVLLHHLAKLYPHSSLFVRLWLQGTENQPQIAYAKRKLRCLMVSKGSNSWIQGQECYQWLSIFISACSFSSSLQTICLYFFHPHDNKHSPRTLNFTCYRQVQPSGKGMTGVSDQSLNILWKNSIGPDWIWCPSLEQ